MKNDTNSFVLINWIKQQQEIEQQHKAKMVIKHYEDDKEFIGLLSVVATKWGNLKVREKTFVMSLIKFHDSVRNMSSQQRSAIVGIYLKYR